MQRNNNPVYTALLLFSELAEPGRGEFIVALNEFLLASPKRRKSMQNNWAGEPQSAAAGRPLNQGAKSQPSRRQG